jgi:hypothetical protein
MRLCNFAAVIQCLLAAQEDEAAIRQATIRNYFAFSQKPSRHPSV